MENPAEIDIKKDLVSGVFSTQKIRKVGTGTTTRKTIQKSFLFCQEEADGKIVTQLLNCNFIPAGRKYTISKEEFLERFSPEPEFYISNVYPKIRELNRNIALADRHRSNKELYSAEMEYGNALHLDIESVRANFGLGLTYLERGDNEKAENIFHRIIKLDAAFESQHKHLFNDFGISLRKNGMIDAALKYYTRAVTLSQQDENLFYNIARAYLAKKDIPAVISYIEQAIALNPSHDVSIKFMYWLKEKKLVPDSCTLQVNAVFEKIEAAVSHKTTSAAGTIAAADEAASTADAPFTEGAFASAQTTKPTKQVTHTETE